MRTKGIDIGWGLGYMNQGCFLSLGPQLGCLGCFGADLCGLELLVLFGVLVMQSRGCYIVWGPICTKEGFWNCLEAGLWETELLASLGDLAM